MQCRVLFFAELADLAGAPALSIELPEGATVADAMDLLCARHAALATRRASVAVAVDEAYVGMETVLTEGCAMALIPPVSGG